MGGFLGRKHINNNLNSNTPSKNTTQKAYSDARLYNYYEHTSFVTIDKILLKTTGS